MVSNGKKINKIAFRLDANNEIGMGHAVRCSALAEAFMDFGCRCAYFCRENREIREFAQNRGFDFVPVPVTELQDELQWMQNALLDYDAVIIDSYFVSDGYIDALNRPGFTVVCYDDNALYEYSCDAVLNGNLHAPSLNYRFGKKRPEMLLGGQFALLRREFWDAVPIEIRESAKKILVCFGGSDLRNYTPAVISVLGSIPDVEITAVLGAMTECDDKVREAAGDNVRVIKNPPSMAEVMQGCDIAVTAGGSMVYELSALGIPSLIVVQADNQKLIAEFLDRNGLMKCVGDWQRADLGILRHEVLLLLKSHARRLCEHADLVQLVSRGGAVNAAERLIRIIEVNGQNVNT